MSSQLSEVDRELLGEIPHNNGAEATMAKANGEPAHGALEGSQGAEFHPLNAAAGTLVKISSSGAELEPGNNNPTGDAATFLDNMDTQANQDNQDTVLEDTKAVPKTPKKRGAAAAANDDSAQPTKKRSPVKKATAPTNLDANTNGKSTETITPPKKRASPKKKNATDIKIGTDNGEPDGETEGQEPVTPKKGKRDTTKGKATKTENDVNTSGGSTETTDQSVSPTKSNGEIEGTTIHNTLRKRQAPKKELALPRGIPSSWDNADRVDRMLVTMKEDGAGWTEIRAAWKKATGQDTAPSTLPNRYNRIKVNMMHLKEGDEKHLLAAKKDIEDAHAATFWANVAANMERRGADKYPVAFIHKTFKELEAAGKTDMNAAAANGTNDTNDTNGTKDNDDVVMKEGDTGDKGDDEA